MPPQTSYDDGKGNWSNPRVQAAHRASYHQTAPYAPVSPNYQPLPAAYPPSYRPARLSLGRRLLSILLLLASLLTGLAASGAYWAQTNLVSAAGFEQLTAPLAQDADFQQALAQAVTADLLASEPIASYLGDGQSQAWYGGIQNWLYDQAENLMSQSTESLVASEAYPQLWQETIEATHSYNFSADNQPARLDFSPFYQAALTGVQNRTGLTLGLEASSLPGARVALEAEEGPYPVSSSLRALADFAAAWQTYALVSGGLLLLAVLLWPGKRLAFAAVSCLLAAGGTALLGLISSGLSLTSSIPLPALQSAALFLQRLSEAMTASLASSYYGWAGVLFLAGLGLTLLAILSSLLGLTARASHRLG